MPRIGTPEVVDAGSMRGRALDVDRRRAAAEDRRPAGLRGRDLGRGDRVGHDLAVDVRLAHPPGDQLGVLGAEVDDEDRVDGGVVIGARASCELSAPSPRPGTSAAPCPRSAAAGATMTSAFWNSLTVS